MAKGSSSTTIYLVGLIFAILISMGLLFACYQLNEDLSKQKNIITGLENEVKKEKDSRLGVRAELKLSRILLKGDDKSEVRREWADDLYLADANKELQTIVNGQWVATEGELNEIKDETVKQIWTDMQGYPFKTRPFKTFPEVIKAYRDTLKVAVQVLPLLRYSRGQEIAKVEALRGDILKIKKEKNKEIADASRRHQREVEGLLGEIRGKDKDLTRVRGEKDNVQKHFVQQKKDHDLEKARLENKGMQLQERIRQLVKKKTKSFTEYSEPDAMIVHAEPALGYTWINLGHNDGLRRNIRFQVYRFVKGGRQQIKGVIEVRRIEDDMAQCAILEDQQVRDPITGKIITVPDRNDPIVKGDLIRNPYFDKEEQKVFVFLGSKLQNRYYNLAEIKRRITEAGGKVESEVSTSTHFVVLLSEGDEGFQIQYDRAAQFGVIFMREAELMEYLGRR
ncbi:MAG: hypothetical protein JKY65_08080 [Planctomycetes bacterium]|nr:hypothetical protein [Planctomycetota bacterium]